MAEDFEGDGDGEGAEEEDEGEEEDVGEELAGQALADPAQLQALCPATNAHRRPMNRMGSVTFAGDVGEDVHCAPVVGGVGRVEARVAHVAAAGVVQDALRGTGADSEGGKEGREREQTRGSVVMGASPWTLMIFSKAWMTKMMEISVAKASPNGQYMMKRKMIGILMMITLGESGDDADDGTRIRRHDQHQVKGRPDARPEAHLQEAPPHPPRLTNLFAHVHKVGGRRRRTCRSCT